MAAPPRWLLWLGGGLLLAGGFAAYRKRRALAGLLSRFRSPFPFVAPVPSGWGDPRPYRNGVHEGVDFNISVGTPVLAIASGKVLRTVADPCNSAGLHVVLEHDGGEYRSIFMHLSRIDVRAGQPVARSQQLGLSGRTGGGQTGPGCTFSPGTSDHLHLTVQRRKDRIPPGAPRGTERDGYVAVPAEPLVEGSYADRVVVQLVKFGVSLTGGTAAA